LPPLRQQIFEAFFEVVTGRSRDRDDFGQRVTPRFTGLGLDRIQNPIALLENTITEAVYDACALRKRKVFPANLRFSGLRDGATDYRKARNLNISNDLSGCWISNFDKVAFLTPNYNASVMDKDALQQQMEEMEEASERWRAERRRLNAEIDKLETALSDAKAAVGKKSKETAPSPDPRSMARLQEAAEQKIKKAAADWETERSKLNSKINRLEGALAEAISRASNPLRVTQSVKEQFELELNRVAKEKTDLEQAFLRAKTEWEQERLRATGELVKLRRAAQIMGRPIPSDDTPEINPKVRDLQNQLKENLSQWNTERRHLAMQIQKLEEASRQWATERRQLNDHGEQLQVSLSQAEAKIHSYEIAARNNDLTQVEVEELKRHIKDIQRENDTLQRLLREGRETWESEQSRLTTRIEELQMEFQRVAEKGEQLNTETMHRLVQEKQNLWESERRSLKSEIKQLQEQLQLTSEKREDVSGKVLDQLRQQYDQRLHEVTQQKTQLAAELRSASALLEAERARPKNGKKNGGADMDTQKIEAEISRVEGVLSEIVAIIEDPNSELSVVIRKNVEKAELDSYLKGMLFTLGRQ